MSQQTPYGPPSGPVPPPGYPPARPGYAPGPSPGYPPTGPQKTNTMAILGLIFAFVFSPLGIVFSAIGLGQVKERRERGRGLAIAGLILSIVMLVLGAVVFVLVLTGLGVVVDRAMVGAPETADALRDPEGVLAACEAIIPAMVAFESDMASVTTPEEYAAVISDTRATIETAAATAEDAVFVDDVQLLSDDLQLAADAIANGEDPSYLMDTLTEDAGRVDATCAEVGYSD